MAMNTPNNQPQDVQPTVAPEVQAAPEVAQPVEQAAPAPEQAPAEGAAPQEQEAQVIEEVAQGLADDEISAADIMTAVLSDTLGLSPSGAQSLFNLLMEDLMSDAQEQEQQQQQPQDVPPEQPQGM